MIATCPECGAALPEGAACRANLDALLGLEWRLPGGPGELAHFYAVATYNLQHPQGMNLTAEALAGLRAAVRDALAGSATMDELRRRARRGNQGTARVTRRAGDTEVRWNVATWPMNVADVLSVEAEAAAYADRVTRWARSVLDTLDVAQA